MDVFNCSSVQWICWFHAEKQRKYRKIKENHKTAFFSVQRLHGSRQVVQHVLLHVARWD
jgi:hypothetical protein